MEMERINENTIRVSIDNDDLAERGITFLDLLGNQKQIETFFYSILEEVDVDEQFQETDSVTFQVLPNHDGLELFISKNLPVDNMDDVDNLDMMKGDMLSDDFTDFLKEHISDQEAMLSEEIDEEIDFLNNPKGDTMDVIFRLDDFETMISLAKNIKLHNVLTYLYKFKDDYFFRVAFVLEENNDAQIKNDVSQLYEYTHITNITTDILEEYGDIVMERNALELTRYYFK